jgi:tRNA G18 (ribose-2'-O)-methylase SpoU
VPHNRAAVLRVAAIAKVSKEEIVTPEKKTDQTTKSSAQTTAGGRKPWVPRTPVDVILAQIHKQEARVTELQAELDAEKAMLTKLLQAKKLLEST